MTDSNQVTSVICEFKLKVQYMRREVGWGEVTFAGFNTSKMNVEYSH